MIAIGVEVRPGGLRAVVVTGRGAIGDLADAAGGDDTAVEAGAARLADRIQPSPTAPTWIAWARPDVAIERVDITGIGPAGLARLLGERAGRGVSAVMIESDPDGSQRMVGIRWDQRGVDRVADALAAVGFAVVGVVPAALARSWAPDGRDGAHGAALGAAGLVVARPARSLTADQGIPTTAPPWVIERVAERPPGPPRRPRRRRRWFGNDR